MHSTSYLTYLVLLIVCDTLVVPTYQLPVISGESPVITTTEESSTDTSFQVFFDDPPTSSPPLNDLEVTTDEPDPVSTNLPSESQAFLLEDNGIQDEETSTDASVKFVDVPEDFRRETTTDVISNAHPLTSDILDELNSLWTISEQLDDDTNSGLKRSLTSLVHMTYARVYDFDEDSTLSKLKSLLRLLRSKLSSHSIERRSLKDSNDSSVKAIPLQINSRRKNNSRFALEDQNSLFPSFSWEDENTIKNEYEITHHKNPQDKWETHHDTSSTTTSTTRSTTTSTLPPSTSTSNVALPLTVTMKKKPSPLTVFAEKDFSTKNSTESPLAATVDEILSSIIAILNEPQRLPPSDVTPQKPPVSSSSSSLPSYLNSFLVGVPLITSSEMVSSNSINKMGDFSTPPVNSTATSPDAPPPTSMSALNSTMERIVFVFTIFSNMSNSTRMTLVFATAIAAVSLAIGYFVMGAPMIVVGVLVLVLTLFFIASLQSSVGKKKRVDDKDDVLISEDATTAILSLIADAVKLYKHKIN